MAGVEPGKGIADVTEFNPTEYTCMDCGKGFLIPEAEQQFRRERGLRLPDACPDCRAKLRAARNGDLIALYERLGSLDEPEPAAGYRGRSNGGVRGANQGTSRQLYAAVCAACGTETRVPFVPRQDRPVYCRDCYNARRGR